MEEFYLAQSIGASAMIPALVGSTSAMRSEPPYSETLKVNVDASVQLGKWGGVGVVIRDFDGVILVAVTWAISPNLETHEVEVWACYMGLKITTDCYFMDIVLESDNVEVAYALSSHKKQDIILALRFRIA